MLRLLKALLTFGVSEFRRERPVATEQVRRYVWGNDPMSWYRRVKAQDYRAGIRALIDQSHRAQSKLRSSGVDTVRIDVPLAELKCLNVRLNDGLSPHPNEVAERFGKALASAGLTYDQVQAASQGNPRLGDEYVRVLRRLRYMREDLQGLGYDTTEADAQIRGYEAALGLVSELGTTTKS